MVKTFQHSRFPPRFYLVKYFYHSLLHTLREVLTFQLTVARNPYSNTVPRFLSGAFTGGDRESRERSAIFILLRQLILGLGRFNPLLWYYYRIRPWMSCLTLFYNMGNLLNLKAP